MQTLAEQIRDARRTHDILSVLGLDGTRERVIVCPLPFHAHHHNTPSFSIFWRRGMQWWRCHGSCNMEGDVVDLVGFLRVNGYDKSDPGKIREALYFLDQRYEIAIPKAEPEIRLAGDEWRKFLPIGGEALQYAEKRGLVLATLEKFRIGSSGHYLTMPCFEEGILRGIKMRNIWESADKKHRFFQLEGSRLGLFNFDAVYLKRGLTWIVKGEIPVMIMDQVGFPQTCAPTGGEGGGKTAGFNWNTALALAAKIVIGDNDGPGGELARNRAILFGAELFFPPDSFKDLDEWILADPSHATQQLKAWEEKVKSEWY
jgi:hypothetical protein